MATNAPGGLLTQLSDELANAVETAGQAIVTVNGRARGGATGILWPDSGIVVTASHVLERDDNLTVTYAGGEQGAATIAGRDRGSDLAVLRVSGVTPPAAVLASGEPTRPGQLVAAIGRPADETMATFGIISATGGRWRTATGGTLDAYIRADIGLLPGFSGGPLVDMNGRVVGINSWYLANGQEVAIPTATARPIIEALLKHGAVKRGYLGVSSQPVDLPEALRTTLGVEQTRGLLLVSVESGSPADAAKLLVGDILVSLDGQALNRPEDLRDALGPDSAGRAVAVVLARGGQRQEIHVTLGSRE